jgi:uncharacterized protein (UPF0335 family)
MNSNDLVQCVLDDAKAHGFTPQSILTVVRHRAAIAAGKTVRAPCSAITRVYQDALEGRLKGGPTAALRRYVERIEQAMSVEQAVAA